MSEMLLRILRIHANTFVCNNTHTWVYPLQIHTEQESLRPKIQEVQKRHVQWNNCVRLGHFVALQLQNYAYCTQNVCTGHTCAMGINYVYWT